MCMCVCVCVCVRVRVCVHACVLNGRNTSNAITNNGIGFVRLVRCLWETMSDEEEVDWDCSLDRTYNHPDFDTSLADYGHSGVMDDMDLELSVIEGLSDKEGKDHELNLEEAEAETHSPDHSDGSQQYVDEPAQLNESVAPEDINANGAGKEASSEAAVATMVSKNKEHASHAHTVTEPSDEEVKKALEDEICSIISVHGQAGLDMVTANAVRKNLEAKFNCSLRSKKNFLKTSLINIIDSRNSSALEALPPPPPPGPPPLIPSPRPAAKDSSTKAKTASKSKKRSEEKTKEFSVPTVTHNDRERKKSKRQFNEISDTEGEYDDHNEGIYERVTQTRGVNSKGARSAAKKVKHTQPMTYNDGLNFENTGAVPIKQSKSLYFSAKKKKREGDELFYKKDDKSRRQAAEKYLEASVLFLKYCKELRTRSSKNRKLTTFCRDTAKTFAATAQIFANLRMWEKAMISHEVSAALYFLCFQMNSNRMKLARKTIMANKAISRENEKLAFMIVNQSGDFLCAQQQFEYAKTAGKKGRLEFLFNVFGHVSEDTLLSRLACSKDKAE